MKPALIIGSTCVDVIIHLDHLPVTQEDLHPSSQTMAIGGCDYNVSHIMRLLDAPHTFISPVGTGMYGNYVADRMQAAGIPVSVRIPDRDNGCCYCLVEASGERTFLSYHGVEYTFQESWMEPYDASSFGLTYICGLEVEEPTGICLISWLEKHPGLELCYAPGPRGCRISREKTDRIMALHPMLHSNEQESLDLTGAGSYEKAADILNGRTCRRRHNPKPADVGRNGLLVLLGKHAHLLQLSYDGGSSLLAGHATDVAGVFFVGGVSI